jgi:hypothetical protein
VTGSRKDFRVAFAGAAAGGFAYLGAWVILIVDAFNGREQVGTYSVHPYMIKFVYWSFLFPFGFVSQNQYAAIVLNGILWSALVFCVCYQSSRRNRMAETGKPRTKAPGMIQP